MGFSLESIAEKWRKLKNTPAFHDIALFCVFVAISALFWVILALNDNAQDSFNVKVSVINCPDSVTFISDIPERVHVGVRDKGTVIWRNQFRHPSLNINFKEYASGGVLKFTQADMMAQLKTIFGSGATITSTSLDSLNLIYTTNKGKRVPVVVQARVVPSSGNVIEGQLKPAPSNVLVYGTQSELDTIHKVLTQLINIKDISETTEIDVPIKRIEGVRILPSKVKVKIPVEPLVRKEALVTITPVNVPQGESLLLFPSKVPVEYYVAMSRLNEDDDPYIELQVDHDEVKRTTDKLKVTVISYPERLKNLSLKNDSVEFTIVKN